MKKILLLCFLATQAIMYAQPNINQPDDIIHFEFPLDGFSTFDLTVNETEMLNGIDPATVTVTYYETLVDAQNQTFAIPSPTSWANISNPQTIYVNVSEQSSGLFSTTNFDIEVSDDVVNIPDANFLMSLISQGVDTNNSGNIQSFEAQSVTTLSVDEQTLDITGLEAFTNLIELSSNFGEFSSYDFSSFPDLEILDITTIFGSTGSLNLTNNLNLKTLNIFNTSINSLDLSNNTQLETLYLSETQLSTLDLTNNTLLEELTVQSYNLITLDLNNNSNLESLFIAGNPLLETVFIKNGSDESINMDGGSWLENWGFGNNPSLQYVCADADQVAEIQGFAEGAYVVNSFCDFQPGGDFNTITGTTQFDLNNDGCDFSDPVVPFVNIEVGNGPNTLVPAVSSDASGVYNLYFGQAGNYTVQPFLENPTYFNISPNFPIVNISFIDNSSTTQDFCLTANGAIADAEVVIAPIMPSRPGFDAIYKLVYKNKGNQVLSGSVDFQYDDTVLDFVSSTSTPDTQNTGSLTYNFSNLLPFESRTVEITLNVNGPTETPPINIDDVLDYSSTINIDQTEETPEDNTFDYSETVVGAFDPNDITCLQGDIVPDTEIGEFLHYMIRFENTGNAPAENVIVTSEINASDFNINTLQILNASHEMNVRVNNGILEFIFENIQLAGGGGHGNILLKMRTRSDLTISDEVDAKADIYFDFNFPIETNVANTEFTVLSTNKFDKKQNISIYPNPSDLEINIETLAPIQNIKIYDLHGRIVLSQNNSDSNLNLKLDVSNLSKGIYLIKLETSEGQFTQKLIKE
ncbi:T9SS type A sorting domain-containing protein [Psychroflexus aestuariivivens]|uniref:T9SS type A sorting domain-containing protein n=1 Tax=Psychroflexus aestuariivivens TaxID=1795040 RepID=UPI000FDB996D|nr:T9SS type A sorting domain-containing protein [Psychroflexus aestuariivivens]